MRPTAALTSPTATRCAPLILWTVQDAARALDRSVDLVKYLVRTGRLRCYARTPSGVHLFTEADVLALLTGRLLAAAPSRPPTQKGK